MTVYYITIALVAILALYAQKRDFPKLKVDEKTGKVLHTKTTFNLFLFASLILIFVAGFRFFVGADFGTYYTSGANQAAGLIESIKKLDEPGIKLIYWLVRLFSDKNYLPILVFSIITIGASMIVIYRNTNHLFMATMLFIFLGCWHSSFNAVRQCLAATILFAGFKYLKRKEFWRYAITVFVAFLFHRSAIIMIAPYFIMRNKISFKNITILVIGSLIVLYSYDLLLSFAEFILQDSLSGDLAYATKDVNIIRILVASAPALFYITIYWGRDLSKESSFYIKLTIVNAIVMIMSSRSAMLARIGIYTAPFCAIAIPELNREIHINTRKIVNVIMLILYGIYFFYEVANSSSLNNFMLVFSHIN